MKRADLRLADYLGHILQAIERIELYTHGLDEAGFAGTSLVQDAVLRNFEIIGEASRNIESRYPEFGKAHPELSLGHAYRLRNAVIHGYFTVDVGVIWKTIRQDLPELRARIHEARDKGQEIH
jgi:uncharacterized protein with HEPN domain